MATVSWMEYHGRLPRRRLGASCSSQTPSHGGHLRHGAGGCCVARRLPAGLDLLLRAPSSSPQPRPFWRWRDEESKRLLRLGTPAAAQQPRHTLAAVVSALTCAAASAATDDVVPHGVSWRRSATATSPSRRWRRTRSPRPPSVRPTPSCRSTSRRPTSPPSPLDVAPDATPAEVFP